jgi:hypothetical protein
MGRTRTETRVFSVNLEYSREMIGTVSGLARLVAALEGVQNANAPNLKSPNPKRPIQAMVAINATANNVAGQMRRKIMTPDSIFAAAVEANGSSTTKPSVGVRCRPGQ